MITLVLVTYRDIFQWLTRHQGMESAESLQHSAVVRLSPQDMQTLGVVEGGRIRLKSATATIVAQVKAAPTCPQGFGYMPVSAYVNQLTSYDGSRNLPDFKHIEVVAEAVVEAGVGG